MIIFLNNVFPSKKQGGPSKLIGLQPTKFPMRLPYRISIGEKGW